MSRARKIRMPLDHHECDALDLRIRSLNAIELTEREAGELRKLRRDLRKADRSLARILFDAPLPETSLRPTFWNEIEYAMSPLRLTRKSVLDDINCAAGWCHRVREYIERLENKYGVTPECEAI